MHVFGSWARMNAKMEPEELAAYTEESHTIQDSAGTPYTVRLLRSDDSWDLKVLSEGREMGLANCQCHGKSLRLADIEILATAASPAVPSTDATPRPAQSNYRGRGLGSALLELIVAQARLGGFHQITGMLHPQNLQDKTDLPEWYRKRGFTVRLSPDQRGGTIHLDLRPDESDLAGA